MVDSAVALQADPERAAAEMQSALEFQIELAKVNFIDSSTQNLLSYCPPLMLDIIFKRRVS